MNTHLKQLWAAMKLPKNFKKSYKFFCLGLDIRVLEAMKTQYDMGAISKESVITNSPYTQNVDRELELLNSKES